MKAIKEQKSIFKEIEKIVESCLIMLFIIGLVYITGQVYGSLQTIDTVYNAERLTGQLSSRGYNISTFFDTGSDGVSRPILNYYAPAVNGLKTGFIEAIILALLLGVFLERRKRNEFFKEV